MKFDLRKSLFTRLLVVVLVFCIAMTTACMAIMRIWHGSFHDEIGQLIAQDYSDVVTTLAPLLGVTSEADAVGLLSTVSQVRPGTDAFLINAQGAVLASSLQPEFLVRDVVNMEPVRLFLSQEGLESPLYGDNPREGAGTSIFSVAPIEMTGSGDRFIYLTIPEARVDQSFLSVLKNYELKEGIYILIMSALLGVIATAIVMRVLLKDLEYLESAMRGFRDSGFTAAPPLLAASDTAGDEIQRLAVMFREQAELLIDRFDQLERSAETRKELLANVSHDFRTPIATLMAHLETLAGSSEMSADESARYFEISQQQCRNLSELVEQLLIIARLEGGEVPYDPEVFRIGELLHDFAQKTQLRATDKGVKLSVKVDSELPPVVADIALIERALENLVDNSLRYTAAPGEIELKAEMNGQAICIRVTDTGVGIPAAERENVVERFYRLDRSRGQHSGNAGLGLAIVSEIVRLHGGDIAIESEEGVGTTVSFDLQRGA